MGSIRRAVILVSVAAMLAAHACARPATAVPRRPVGALSTDSAVAAMTAAPLWPGFDPMRTPVALFDGTRTWLFRHPGPPSGYVAVAGRPGVAAREGRDLAITANSSAPLGGVPTATVMLDPRWSVTDAAAVTIHELFHVFQRATHPQWEANEADLFTYPFEDSLALALRREETNALRRAIETPTDETARCWARAFVDARTRRFAVISPEASAYERGTELNEGLAHYVEQRAAGRSIRLADDPPPAQVRQRAYAVGAGIGVVLDRVHPRWRDRIESSPNPRPWLDSTLASVVGPAGGTMRCVASEAERAGWMAQASLDVRHLLAERDSTRSAYLARPGWRLEIDPGSTAFFPRRFDPLNVARLSATEVLHSRYLTLQGELGTIELLGGAALTEGASGVHPLFSGIRRVTLTGLRLPPIVRASNGALEVRGVWIHAWLRGARADTVGDTIRLRRR
jgi:hypothetical protein